jgi:hypothetical protein
VLLFEERYYSKIVLLFEERYLTTSAPSGMTEESLN